MKTLIELKQVAESKGLRFEVNKWDPTIKRWETDRVPNPDFMKCVGTYEDGVPLIV